MIFKTKKSETEHKIPFSKMIKKKVVVAIEIFSKHVPKIVLSGNWGGGSVRISKLMKKKLHRVISKKSLFLR